MYAAAMGRSWVARRARTRTVERKFAPSEPFASIKVREPPGVNDFRNLYLLAGLRGSFERTTLRESYLAEAALADTPTRWGIHAPWGPCDGGADLDSVGDNLVRGWAHVDLRTDDAAPRPDDVSLAGLLRSMWDSLELFGNCTLTGLDAIVPIDCVGTTMRQRVVGSAVFHRLGSERPVRIAVQVADWRYDDQPLQLDRAAVLSELSTLAEALTVTGDAPPVSYPESSAEHPFGPSPRHQHGVEPFAVEVTVPTWSIDDAAWLAEVLSVACVQATGSDEVEIALRRIS
jgi:hypothetical protein